MSCPGYWSLDRRRTPAGIERATSHDAEGPIPLRWGAGGIPAGLSSHVAPGSRPNSVRSRCVTGSSRPASRPAHLLVTDDHDRVPPAAGRSGRHDHRRPARLPGGRTCWQPDLDAPHAVPGLRRLTGRYTPGAISRSARRPVADARSNQATALAPVRFFSIRSCGSPRRRPARTSTMCWPRTPMPPGAGRRRRLRRRRNHSDNYLASAFLSPLLNRRDDGIRRFVAGLSEGSCADW